MSIRGWRITKDPVGTILGIIGAGAMWAGLAVLVYALLATLTGQ